MNEPSPTVRWFKDLGMADLEEVGGKNASLGEMVSQLADLGVRVPNGFATTAAAYRSFIGDTGLAERIDGLLDGLDTDDVRRLAEVGTEIRAAVVAQEFPADLEADVRAAYDELVEESGEEPSFAVRSQRHRRGPARRVVRRPAGDVPQRPRHRRGAHRDPRGVRVALQRPGDRLPRAPRLRARRGRAVGRRAADGALRHRRLGGHVHHGHRVGLHRRGVRDLGLRPRRGRRAGGRQPRRVLRLQARAPRRAPRGAQARRRRQGDQDGLHRRRDGRPDHRVRRRRPRGPAAAQPHRRRGRGAGPPRAGHRGPLRPADGHRVGQGRRRRADLRPPGPPRDRPVPGDRRARALQDAEGVRRRCRGAGRGPRDRPEDRRRRGPGAQERRPDERLPGRRGARRRHDRPRLGADHEAGRRDRDQPRRPDLPRRDHRPRARHPRRGRLRQRDPGPGRRPRGDGLVRRGRHRARLRGPARLLGRAHRARHDARHPGEDHDERRHAGAGVLVRPAAAPRRRPGPARVRHQPADRHPPAGAAPARVGP